MVQHVRRRRRCESLECDARLTTVEVVVESDRPLLDPIAVPRALVAGLAERLSTALLKPR
jgi:hypothetical protein